MLRRKTFTLGEKLSIEKTEDSLRLNYFLKLIKDDFRHGAQGSHGDLRPISSVINWKSMVSKYLEVKGIDLGTTPQDGSQED
ncbi:hypothetical protein TNCV_2598541 [Trichonephila clavipes]|nr:hypothetical protein TNCV_2598541 [Trichonephila clavipes]